jgi:hypothetical protein
MWKVNNVKIVMPMMFRNETLRKDIMYVGTSGFERFGRGAVVVRSQEMLMAENLTARSIVSAAYLLPDSQCECLGFNEAKMLMATYNPQTQVVLCVNDGVRLTCYHVSK